MTSSRVLLAILLTATTAHAKDQFQDGLIKYLSQVSSKRHKDPEGACKEWATWKKSTDAEADYKLKKAEKGKKGYYNCVFEGPDGKPYTQDDGAAPVVICPSGWDPYGVDDDQKCIKRAKGAAAEPVLCLAKLKDATRKPKTLAAVETHSKANIAKLKKDPFGESMLEAYDHEKECIENSEYGWPKFEKDELYPFGPNDLNIGSLCGTRNKDFAAANEMAGYPSTPKDYTWHHHQDLGRMQLVATKAHAPKNKTSHGHNHFGGVSVWNAVFCALDPAFRMTMCGYRENDDHAKAKKRDPYLTHCAKKK